MDSHLVPPSLNCRLIKRSKRAKRQRICAVLPLTVDRSVQGQSFSFPSSRFSEPLHLARLPRRVRARRSIAQNGSVQEVRNSIADRRILAFDCGPVLPVSLEISASRVAAATCVDATWSRLGGPLNLAGLACCLGRVCRKNNAATYRCWRSRFRVACRFLTGALLPGPVR